MDAITNPRWKRKPAQRPQQILEAALAVFGRHGVANTAVDDIAARAGVSKGTIYLYFTNKEQLFSEAILHAFERRRREKPPAAPATATGQLSRSLARQWDYLTAPAVAAATRLIQAERRQFPELVKLYRREVVDRFTAEVAAIVRQGADGGEFRAIDPDASARMLTALVTQLAQWRATGEVQSLTEKSSEAVLSELTDFYLQAITPSGIAFPQADGA